MSNKPDSGTITIVSVVVAVLTGGYMAPWAVARVRGTTNATAVFWINLALGWTIIGWIVALVMSLRATSH